MLSPAHRAQFLARHQIAVLERLPDGAVTAAIGRSARLAAIVELAQQAAWWFKGERCEADDLPYCARCKPHPFPATVVMTRGWSYAFHRDDRCTWLVEGQAQVDRRDGECASVERVAVQVALGAGKVPCRGCFRTAA